MLHKIDFTPQESERAKQLLAICRSTQGEYLPSHHGPGSWATTYSTEFISAATELYSIVVSATINPPIPRYSGTRYHLNVIFNLLAQLFNEAGIRSCRRSMMDIDNVRYLFEAHIMKRLK